MSVLPWIQSTGTQYIDTGIIGKNDIDVELCVFFTESFSDWHFLLGSRLANVDHSYTIGIDSLRKITIQRGTNIWYDASYTFNLDTDYTIKIVGTHLYINGEDICSVSDQAFESPVSMYLFAANLNGIAEAFIPMAVKYCKIWENGVLVRDYIPTIDNGHIGLWDNVSGSFFSDAAGGNFITTKWYVGGEGTLTNDELQELLPSMEKPYPLSLWRVENGVLTNGLLVKLLGEDIWALHRKSQIYVYDLHEPQTGFNSNGLAALDPISCTSWHDDDRWDVELTHPLDEWGKWKYLLPENIIKVRGQLFRIDRYLPKISGSERMVSIHASHISTDMAAQIIRQATFTGGTAAQFIDFAFSSVDEPFYSEGLAPYRFEGYSNIAENLGETELVNTSLWAAIVGADNCLINRYGGELYRDNFYFSVYDRMQYAKDNAFRLRYSLDMTEISQTIDYTDFCTELHGRDNFGNEYAVWWNEGVSWAVHHPRQRAVSFTYSDFDTAFDSLVHDVEALFFASDYPKVTYEMSLANLKNDPRYADFLQLQDYQYGDSGSIYCPELDINTVQKIVAEQRDELTGDVLRMTLGNMKNSWVRPSLLAGTVSSGSSVEDKQRKALQEELKKTKLKALPDWKSARTYTWAEMRQFTWKETKTHGN